MTHLWKTSETYVFDMPEQRIMDVYGKNVRCPLAPYLKILNPKISEVKFDEKYAAVLVEIGIPKYPDQRPYFNSDDTAQLLETYMAYANMSLQEIMDWYKERTVNINDKDELV